MTWAHILVGVTSASLVLVGTVVSARWQARVGHQSNRTADWDAYGQRMSELQKQMEQWTTRQLEERDRRIEMQGQRIASLEGTVRQLEQENEHTTSKYWKAIVYSRAWRARHPESVLLIEVPPEIADDL